MFDLLEEKEVNQVFRVAFDFYTPRPHFILLQKHDDSLPEDFGLMETTQLNEMFLASSAMLYHYNINFAILSIHRGSWISQTHEFLAHLCVNLQDYVRVFEQMECSIPNWPSEDYVTRKWVKKEPDSYVYNVSRYPSKSYLANEVAEVQEYIDVGIKEIGEGGNEYEGVSLIYHSSHPKIGFQRKKGISPRKMLDIMERFASSHQLTAGCSDDNGCHLCLYLGTDDAEQAEWNIGATVDIVGYIVTTGKRFYQLCPVEHQQSWFHAFRTSGFNCVT